MIQRSTVLVLGCASVLMLGLAVARPGVHSQPRSEPVAEPATALRVPTAPTRSQRPSRSPEREQPPGIEHASKADGKQVVPEAPRERTEAERLVFAERAFTAQAHDVSWERQADYDVKTILDGVRRDSVKVDDVACRGSMCRVRLAPAQAEQLRVYLRDFLDTSRWPGPASFIRDTREDGSVALTMFLVRQGLELPEPAVEQTSQEQETTL